MISFQWDPFNSFQRPSLEFAAKQPNIEGEPIESWPAVGGGHVGQVRGDRQSNGHPRYSAQAIQPPPALKGCPLVMCIFPFNIINLDLNHQRIR